MSVFPTYRVHCHEPDQNEGYRKKNTILELFLHIFCVKNGFFAYYFTCTMQKMAKVHSGMDKKDFFEQKPDYSIAKYKIVLTILYLRHWFSCFCIL